MPLGLLRFRDKRPPPPEMRPGPEPNSDLFTLISAVTEWNAARDACKHWAGRETTHEGRMARAGEWDRLSKAEHELAKVAARLGRRR